MDWKQMKQALRNDMSKLSLDSQTFEAVICLNADLPDKEIFGKLSGLTIFAADGAAEKLYDIGIMPDYIIGDLDSFNASSRKDSFTSHIIEITDQDSTDFEKNLRYAMGMGYRDILILGIHGGELEHTLNNWSVFMRYARLMNLCILDRGRYGIALFESVSFHTKQNEMISLIPQPYSLLTTENLKWELNCEPLALGVREGTRNISVGDYVALTIHDGSLLVFLDERLPYSPVVTKR